jgi:hypothetical protein
MWIARAEYEDGSEFEKTFPYTTVSNYEKGMRGTIRNRIRQTYSIPKID